MTQPATSAERASSDDPRWSRVLLKLSGEAFAGGDPLGIDPTTVAAIARQIGEVVSTGRAGGGRRRRRQHVPRAGAGRARHGPRAAPTTWACSVPSSTAWPCRTFSSSEGVTTRVQTAIAMGQVAEPYFPLRAIRHLEKGRVVIFGAGLGSAVLLHRHHRGAARAGDQAEAVFKATKVDGVYDSDPKTQPGRGEVRRARPTTRS